ncbi:calcium:proton antiporter [Aeromicrobium terrae]|uniref:Ionic transporter y4hA n=1 Tax=Aeromicrobium terrae TaxID=2498846 RepID=A0A5C8NHD1_9ACTN|nr:ionic transporter y4hA [Aeromicrobium terrae]TXL58008.1 ionic transporter y4hA [Aeromicrobium terrae]
MATVAELLRRARWTISVPLLSLVVLVLGWGRHPHGVALAVVGVFLVAAIIAAVHHAEVVAHRVGEPYGALILAVAVTVIEVGLIVTLMVSGGDETSTLARDTVFAAAMITVNGIAGLALLVGALKHHLAVFSSEGAGAALATVITLATLCLVLPTFTTSANGPEYASDQLAFAAIASLALYGLFVFTQTVRHRDLYLPVNDDTAHEADPPTDREALVSLGLMLVSLVVVVGLAKVTSGAIEDAVDSAGLPQAVVGVAIALLVLAPECIAAVRNALRDRVQISLNLAYGSAMASIGLTIPTLAVASIWLDGPLDLGLESTQIVLLAVSSIVGTLTVVPGRAKPLHGGLHLALLATFIYLSISP